MLCLVSNKRCEVLTTSGNWSTMILPPAVVGLKAGTCILMEVAACKAMAMTLWLQVAACEAGTVLDYVKPMS